MLKAIERNCDIWPKEIYPAYVTILDRFHFIPLAKLWGKKTTGTQHLRYAFSTNKQTQIQQTYKHNKYTHPTNRQRQQTYKHNKHTNIQIQQQQKLNDNKYTNPTSIQIQKNTNPTNTQRQQTLHHGKVEKESK